MAVLSVYKSLLRRRYWSLWLHYMMRKEFRKCSIVRRSSESALICLQRWKVYTVIEKHCQHSRRIKLLRSTFRSWNILIKEKQWEEWYIHMLIHKHTHTNMHSLCLSHTHTHTHTHIYIYMCTYSYIQVRTENIVF